MFLKLPSGKRIAIAHIVSFEPAEETRTNRAGIKFDTIFGSFVVPDISAADVDKAIQDANSHHAREQGFQQADGAFQHRIRQERPPVQAAA